MSVEIQEAVIASLQEKFWLIPKGSKLVLEVVDIQPPAIKVVAQFSDRRQVKKKGMKDLTDEQKTNIKKFIANQAMINQAVTTPHLARTFNLTRTAATRLFGEQ